jgi:hypothetical protein
VRKTPLKRGKGLARSGRLRRTRLKVRKVSDHGWEIVSKVSGRHIGPWEFGNGLPLWGPGGRISSEARLIFKTWRAAQVWYRHWNDGEATLPNADHTAVRVEVIPRVHYP